MTATPQPPAEQYQQPADPPQRRNRLAITATCFAGFALLLSPSSFLYKPGADIATDYAAGRYGTPLPWAIIALACGIPALLRTRRPADQDGRSWDGKETAIISIAIAGLVAVAAVVRIAVFLASR